MKRKRYRILSALTVLLITFVNPAMAQKRILVWSDEFDGPGESSPDSTKWRFDTGGGGWGNNEIEYYTSRLQNVFTDGEGRLVINVMATDHAC